MTTRIVMVDYVAPIYSEHGDQCGLCPRFKKGRCQHFGELRLKPKTKRTYLRADECKRAEERTGHSSISHIMLQGDFNGR